MKKRYLLYTVVLTFLMAACSESVLDKDTIGRFDSSNYLTTADEANSAAYGIYNLWQDLYNGGSNWSSIYLLESILGDDVNKGGSSAADQSKFEKIDNFDIQYDNEAIGDIWNALYTIVKSSCDIINNIPDGLSNTELVRGEAEFFRAYAYFELVKIWGAVPFYTESQAGLSVSLPRTATSEIYTQIEKDLTAAIADLPLKSALADGQKFRISKGAAQALLGKVYLYEKKYTESHAVLSEVIASGEYDLVDYHNIWMKSERAGEESVFSIMFTSNSGLDWGSNGGAWQDGAESNVLMVLIGPRDVFSKLDTLGYYPEYCPDGEGYINGWGFVVPSKKFGDLLVDTAGEIRANTSVISQDAFTSRGGIISQDVINNSEGFDFEGYIRLKFGTKQSESNDPNISLNYNTPYKIIRYSDVLLMAAEAYNRDNQDAKAVIELKKVRERAGFTDHSYWASKTGDDLFEFIKEERSLELAFEGNRYWDLVRWGDASTELSGTGFTANKHELMPIPQSEIDLNPGISASDQNPGY